MEANKDGAQVLLENRSIYYPYSDLLCKYHFVCILLGFSQKFQLIPIINLVPLQLCVILYSNIL